MVPAEFMHLLSSLILYDLETKNPETGLEITRDKCCSVDFPACLTHTVYISYVGVGVGVY